MKKGLCLAVTGVLVAVAAVPVMAQSGIVSDWSNHHVKFMNPGSPADAEAEGRYDAWQRFVNQPRYRAQQIKRSAEWANRFAGIETQFAETQAERDSMKRVLGLNTQKTTIKRDWAVQIAPAGNGVAVGMFPAEYGADYSTASCSDYVIFPVNKAGKNTGTKQANLVAFNNLYKTTCSSTGQPTVKFAYYIGTGTVPTSPAISEDGTKVAFVMSVLGASTFDVLKLDTTGKGNGTAYNAPAVPGTGNNASVKSLTLNGGRNVTYSSPFIDYTNDIAYVGDNSGYLHKITCVFNANSTTCSPAEVTSGGWPFDVVIATSGETLSGPVYDTTSGNIYVGSASGYVYCVNLNGTTPKACTTSRVGIANGSAATDGVPATPMVVSNGTSSWVYSQGNSGSNGNGTGYVMQVPTSASGGFATATYAAVGENVGALLYSGDFDNNYYSATSSYSNAHMYFCGFAVYGNFEEPTLYQIGISSAGVLSTTPKAGPQLNVDSNNLDACTPLTEVYNGTTDYLFLGVNDEGLPSGCNSQACVMSFNLGATFSTTLAPVATLPLGGTSVNASSGIVIDNVSTAAGASQVYFGNMINGDATQASQAGLQ